MACRLNFDNGYDKTASPWLGTRDRPSLAVSTRYSR